MKSNLETIRMSKLRIGENHRSDESEDLSGLMESITNVGLLEPIGVAKDESGGGYRVIYGFRRYWAVKKLGLVEIPCVVHDNLSSADERTINLAENVQRRNPSMAEVGRWAARMRDENKMNAREIAVRLGVAQVYIENAISTFYDIPERYRDQVELRSTQKGSGRGEKSDRTISMRVANAISSADKLMRLTKAEKESLFAAAAEHGERFQALQVRSYAVNIRNGKDLFDGVGRLRQFPVLGVYDQAEWDRLHDKYIKCDPPKFDSIVAIARAIVSGELAETFNIQ